jgi:hypothetical protein
MFPENESQVYEFTMYCIYKVEAKDGNFTVWQWDDYPDTGDRDWYELHDDDVEYWLGVVYAYKMTDDDTGNVYTTHDYHCRGAVGHYIQQLPTCGELEELINYTRDYHWTASYWDWRPRADAWLRRQDLNRARPNRQAEGAD